MVIFTESEILRKQEEFISSFTEDFFKLLDTGKDFFDLFFPETTVSIVSETENKKVPAKLVWEHKVKKIKEWVQVVFNGAMQIEKDHDIELPPPEPIQLPESIAHQVIRTLLKIFTCGRDLMDVDYYFLSDVGTALALKPTTIMKIIEQELYEIRKDFFNALLDLLNEEQCLQCAILLYKAIQADQKIHPAEFKYIENILQLLKNDQSKLHKVEEFCAKGHPMPKVRLNKELENYIFRYLIEIVMCDEEFDPEESKFIQEVAGFFGFDKPQQDGIIQPVASAQMLKRSLFQ